MLRFSEPLWLAAGMVFTLCLGAVLVYLERRQDIALTRFTSRINRSRPGRLTGHLLPLGAMLCLFVGLAEPGYDRYKTSRQDDTGHHVDIIVALDTSLSMMATDVMPSRLDRSKRAIMTLLHHLQGENVGLLSFAGSGRMIVPLTSDYQSIEKALAQVDSQSSSPRGTDIGAAINSAVAAHFNEVSRKSIVIISDGEDLANSAAREATIAAARGIAIFAVGVGTPAGELLTDPQSGHYLKDRTGVYVTTRLNRTAMERIARSGSGTYVDLGLNGEGLTDLYRQKLAPMRQGGGRPDNPPPVDVTFWPAALAILLLMLHSVLGKNITASVQALFSCLFGFVFARRKKGLIVLVTLAIVGTCISITTMVLRQEIVASLMQVRRYNNGITAYENGSFDQAIKLFDSLLTASDRSVQEQAAYNKGNALYRLGEHVLPTDVEAAIRCWQRALTAYAIALTFTPDNQTARENYLFISNRITELRPRQNHLNNSLAAPSARPNFSPDPTVQSSESDPASPVLFGSQSRNFFENALIMETVMEPEQARRLVQDLASKEEAFRLPTAQKYVQRKHLIDIW